jgi:hypothetical protein
VLVQGLLRLRGIRESTYKKQEVNTPSTGTPKLLFDFLRGILTRPQPTRPDGGFSDCAFRSFASAVEPRGSELVLAPG